MRSDYEVSEFPNFISGSIIDTSIKFKMNNENREIDLYSQSNGIVKVNQKKIYNINMYNVIYITVVHNNFEVKENQIVGKIFQIPAKIEKKLLESIISNIDAPLISIKPYIKQRVSIVAVGEDLYGFKKEDGYNEKLSKKLSHYGGNIIYKEINEENPDKIVNSIKRASACSDTIFVIYSKTTDPQIIDKSIKLLKVAEVLPVFIFPGNQTKFFYLEDKAVLILDEDVLNFKISAINIIFSRLACGEKLNFEEMAKYSYGGICFLCPICVYPVCPLGKY
jgi:hypothetical protein